jgi:SAM-dependent methyltransferase
MTDFLSVTELSGDMVSQEQVDRMIRRYYWAGSYCNGKDVLEVACGTGQGIGYLASLARSFRAGDYSQAILAIARKHYGDRFSIQQFDAQDLPFEAASLDTVIIFEALYYIPVAERFFAECKRVLRPGGVLLISNANRDLFDFNPSPHSFTYHGVRELTGRLQHHGFSVECFGDTPIGEVSLAQRVLRPVKALAARAGLIPKSMAAKKLLKRLVFGKLVPLPAEIPAGLSVVCKPDPLALDEPARGHKVILCAATRLAS